MAQKPPQTGNQDLLPTSFLPKSPTSAVLPRIDQQRYVDIKTGAVQFSLPLTSLTSGSLNWPVSLDYMFGGLPVFQSTDLIGLGWSLQAGGVISRQVNGRLDESRGTYGRYVADTIMRYSNCTVSIVPAELDKRCQKFLEAAATQNAETAPDLYTFSVGGYSGKFIFLDTTIHVMANQPVRIRRATVPQKMGGGSGFVLLPETGEQYWFTARETTQPNTHNFGGFGAHTSAWHVTHVVSADYADTLYFKYSTDRYNEPTRCALTTGQFCVNSVNATASDCIPNRYTWHNIMSYGSHVQAQFLESIQTRNASVVFERSAAHILQAVQQYNISARGSRRAGHRWQLTHSWFKGVNYVAQARLRLDHVRESAGGMSLPPHTFRYLDGELPPTESAAQDYWGFYNGALLNGGGSPGTDQAPALLWDPRLDRYAANRAPDAAYSQLGALKQIRYPTGGTVAFDYAQNTCFVGERWVSVPEQHLIASSSHGPNWPTVSDSLLLVLPADKTITIRLDRTTDTDDNQTGPAKNMQDDLRIYRLEPGGQRTMMVSYKPNLVYYETTSFLPAGKYQLVTSAGRHELLIDVTILVPYETLRLVEAPGPGIRVERVSSQAPGVTPPLVRQYQYTSTDSRGTFSSGTTLLALEQMGKPVFSMYRSGSATYAGSSEGAAVFAMCTFDNTSSKLEQQDDLEAVQGNAFFYQRVTEQMLTAMGRPEGETVTYFDSFAQRLREVLPVKEEHYRSHNGVLQLVQKHTYRYGVDGPTPTAFFSVPFLEAKQVFSGYDPGGVNFASKVFEGRVTWLSASFLAPREEIKVQYDERGDSLLQVSVYEYERQRVVRTARRTTSGWQITRLKYLRDYAASLTTDAMRAHNFNPVVETQGWRRAAATADSTWLSGQLLFFDPMLRKPAGIWQLQVSAPVAMPNADRRAGGRYLTFKSDSRYRAEDSVRYDPVTSLLVQRLRLNAMPTAFVWGYNRAYIVAQIENATQAQVQAVLSPAVLAQLQQPDPGTMAQVQRLLAPLRSKLPKAQVTTYTYEPLVGISSQTGPDGRTVFYEYDALGRLLRVRDEQSRILTQQEYKYVDQP